MRAAKEWISDVKFSPDGTILAAGSHDNGIYIHLPNAPKLKQKVKPLKKHSSYITHIDFSLDGNNIHSNCGAYELLFWDVNTGKQVTAGATQFRDDKWATWTATLGWPVTTINTTTLYFIKYYSSSGVRNLARRRRWYRHQRHRPIEFHILWSRCTA